MSGIYPLSSWWIWAWHLSVCVHFTRISLRREGAVSKEVLSDISASGKKLSKAEKDERYASHSPTHSPTLVLFVSGCHGRRTKWLILRLRLLPSSTTTLCTCFWCYFCFISCVPSTQPCILHITLHSLSLSIIPPFLSQISSICYVHVHSYISCALICSLTQL